MVPKHLRLGTLIDLLFSNEESVSSGNLGPVLTFIKNQPQGFDNILLEGKFLKSKKLYHLVDKVQMTLERRDGCLKKVVLDETIAWQEIEAFEDKKLLFRLVDMYRPSSLFSALQEKEISFCPKEPWISLFDQEAVLFLPDALAASESDPSDHYTRVAFGIGYRNFLLRTISSWQDIYPEDSLDEFHPEDQDILDDFHFVLMMFRQEIEWDITPYKVILWMDQEEKKVAALAMIQDDKGGNTHILSLVVAPKHLPLSTHSHRKKGFGTKTIQLLQKRTAKTLMLTSLVISKGFYQANGFTDKAPHSMVWKKH